MLSFHERLAFPVVIFIFFLTSNCESACINKRPASHVIDEFNYLIESSFVGQINAVRTVRTELHDHVEIRPVVGHKEPLIFHFVGPSGTGKSKLAEIISLSLFDDCDSIITRTQGWLRRWSNYLPKADSILDHADFLLRRNCRSKSPGQGRVEHWRQACGIKHISLSRDDGSSSTPVLRKFLEESASLLLEEPRTVLLIDDFAFCDKDCSILLKDLITSSSLRTETGQIASASQALILFCSDLTGMGLLLDRSLSYEHALDLVRETANNYWGKDSVFLTKSILIPFAPLSEREIGRIFDLLLDNVKRIIQNRIKNFELQFQNSNGAVNRWNGQFVCDEDTKIEILDKLHSQMKNKNARVITEELHSRFNWVMKHPVPVEQLLQKCMDGQDRNLCTRDITIAVRKDLDELDIELVIVASPVRQSLPRA